MRNTLKFLIGTICCAMIFGNCGYSMEEVKSNVHNNVPNMNIEIKDVDIDTDPKTIKQLADELRQRRINSGKNNNKIINTSDVFEVYKTLSEIIPQTKEIPLESYLQYLKANGENFANMAYYKIRKRENQFVEGDIGNNPRLITLSKQKYIEQLVTNLLRDTLRFISEHSPSVNQVSFRPFHAAWDILYRYSRVNKLLTTTEKIENITKEARNLGITISEMGFTLNQTAPQLKLQFDILKDSDTDITTRINCANSICKNQIEQDWIIDSTLKETMKIANKNFNTAKQFVGPKKINFSNIMTFLDKDFSYDEIINIINKLLDEYIQFIAQCNINNSPVAQSIMKNAWKKISYYVFLKCNNKPGFTAFQNKLRHVIKNFMPFIFNTNNTLDYKFMLQSFITDVNNEIISITDGIKNQDTLQGIFDLILKVLHPHMK